MAAGVVLLALRASAEPAALRVDYDVPAGCPSKRDFIARVASRQPIPGAEGATDEVPVVIVRVEEAEGGVAWGEVEVRWRGSVAHRVVEGASCEETVTALALAASVALDVPELPEAPRPEVEVAASLETVAASLGATPAASAEAQPEPIPEAAPVARPVRPTRVRDRREPEVPTSGVELGGGLGIHTAPAPAALVGPHAQFRYAGRTPFAHAFALGFSQATSEDHVSTGGRARFDFIVGELRACPWLFSHGPIAVGPCASLEAGTLQGQGSDTTNPTSAAGPWISPGLLLDSSTRMGPVLLAVAGGPALPLVRDRFVFEEVNGGRTDVAHQARPVEFRAEVSVRVALTR